MEIGGQATISLSWSSSCQAKQVFSFPFLSSLTRTNFSFFLSFFKRIFIILQIIPQKQLYPCIAPQNAAGNGLTGSYYTDENLTTLKGTEIDPNVPPLSLTLSPLTLTPLTPLTPFFQINFNWGAGGPAILAGQVDAFSVKWTGHIQPRFSGVYTFYPVYVFLLFYFIYYLRLIYHYLKKGRKKNINRGVIELN
jgi:hypothetical protein